MENTNNTYQDIQNELEFQHGSTAENKFFQNLNEEFDKEAHFKSMKNSFENDGIKPFNGNHGFILPNTH